MQGDMEDDGVNMGELELVATTASDLLWTGGKLDSSGRAGPDTGITATEANCASFIATDNKNDRDWNWNLKPKSLRAQYNLQTSLHLGIQRRKYRMIDYINTKHNILADLLSRCYVVARDENDDPYLVYKPEVMEEFFKTAADLDFPNPVEVVLTPEEVNMLLPTPDALPLNAADSRKRIISSLPFQKLKPVESAKVGAPLGKPSAEEAGFTCSIAFHGIGGSARGAAEFFTIDYGFDKSLDAQLAMQLLRPRMVQGGDAKHLDPDAIPLVDAWFAGAPCQGASSIGLQRGMDDCRMEFYILTVWLIISSGCRIGVLEMVANIVINPGLRHIQRAVIAICEAHGYAVAMSLDNSFLHGCIMHRRRMHTVIVNTRYGSVHDLDPVYPTRQDDDPVCIGELLCPDSSVPSELFYDPAEFNPVDRAASWCSPIICATRGTGVRGFDGDSGFALHHGGACQGLTRNMLAYRTPEGNYRGLTLQEQPGFFGLEPYPLIPVPPRKIMMELLANSEPVEMGRAHAW